MPSSLLSVVIQHHRFMQDNADAEPDDTSNTNGAVVVDGDEGKWILFSIAILMSWCFLAVALAMGYYSWRESRLLLKYQNEGVAISGQVSNIVLLREGSRNNIVANKKKTKDHMERILELFIRQNPVLLFKRLFDIHEKEI